MGLLDADGQQLSNGNGNGRFKISTDKVITVIVTALLTYAAMNARVSVVESRMTNTEQRLERMEDKLDILLRRP